MKKLILFISLTFAFGASFAGTRVDLGSLFIKVKIPVLCINNNELLPVFFDENTLNIKEFASKNSNFSSIKYYGNHYCSYFNESSMPKPKASIEHLKAICLSEFSLMSEQKFKEIFKKNFKGKRFLFKDILEFVESKKAIEKIVIKAENAECGNTGKKIKLSNTIINIKKFFPIILEVEE